MHTGKKLEEEEEEEGRGGEIRLYFSASLPRKSRRMKRRGQQTRGKMIEKIWLVKNGVLREMEKKLEDKNTHTKKKKEYRKTEKVWGRDALWRARFH